MAQSEHLPIYKSSYDLCWGRISGMGRGGC